MGRYFFLKYIAFSLTFFSLFSSIYAQNAQDFLRSGNQKFKQQAYLEARKDYEKAIKLDPKLVKAHHNLGEICYLLGDYDQALLSFNQAITIAPNSPETYCSRAVLFLGNRKFKEAQKDIQKALEYKPDFANAHFIGGNIQWAMGQKKEACQEWKEAVALGHSEASKQIEKQCEGLIILAPTREIKIPKKQPETANQFYKSGNEKMERRSYDLAINDFERAITLDENYAEAYFGLGNAYFAKGNPEKACEYWQKAYDLDYKKAKEMMKGVCDK
jgi:superkiller protein 3